LKKEPVSLIFTQSSTLMQNLKFHVSSHDSVIIGKLNEDKDIWKYIW
jgi:hypothetical protein